MNTVHDMAMKETRIPASKEDAKYTAKYTALKRQIRQVEQENALISSKLHSARKSVSFLRMERSAILERLDQLSESDLPTHTDTRSIDVNMMMETGAMSSSPVLQRKSSEPRLTSQHVAAPARAHSASIQQLGTLRCVSYQHASSAKHCHPSHACLLPVMPLSTQRLDGQGPAVASCLPYSAINHHPHRIHRGQ